MVEQSAVNRWVVGSSPTSGASPSVMFWTYVLQNDRGRFYVDQTESPESRLADRNRSDSFDGKFTRSLATGLVRAHPTHALAMRETRDRLKVTSATRLRLF